MKNRDWEKLAANYLGDNQGREFVWGEFDCCLFAADFIDAITGIDFAAEFRGRYSTEIGAARALKRYGKGDIKSTLNTKLTTIEGRLNARRGDVVLVSVSGISALGVVFDGVWCVSQDSGLVNLPMTSIQHVWRVL